MSTTTTTSSSSTAAPPPSKKKKSTPSFFSLTCGCRDSTSTSISTPKLLLPHSSPSSSSTPKPLLPHSSPSSSSSSSTPSPSSLLRQLSDLECSVLSLPRRRRPTVAVVKDSADPVADFRRSMLAVILDEEISGEKEMQALLRRFLALNHQDNHGFVLAAFAGVWDEVVGTARLEFVPGFRGIYGRATAGRVGRCCPRAESLGV